MDARVINIAVMQKFGEKSVYIGWFMAILEGGHIVPPHTQATSRSPAPLGLSLSYIIELNFAFDFIILQVIISKTAWEQVWFGDNLSYLDKLKPGFLNVLV